MDALELKYKAYLLSFLFTGIDDVIDLKVMSYEEWLNEYKINKQLEE